MKQFYENIKQNFGLLGLSLFVAGTSFIIIWYFGKDMIIGKPDEKQEKKKTSKVADPEPDEISKEKANAFEIQPKDNITDLESLISPLRREETERVRDTDGKFTKSE